MSASLPPTLTAAGRHGVLPRRLAGRRAGLSLVEVLISLAIAAALLTAVAAAYSATASAIEMNDQFFRASQAARVSVNQITTEIRRCQSGVVADDSLELTTDSGQKRTYSLSDNKLMLSFPDELPVPSYRLASNIQSLRFVTNGQTVSMEIIVRVGDNQLALSGSAVPRRTITYN